MNASWGIGVGLKILPMEKDPNLSPKSANLELQIGSKIEPGRVPGTIWGVPGASWRGAGGVREHLETMPVLKEGCASMAGRFGGPFWAVLGPKMGPQIGPRRLPRGFKI